MPRVSCSLMNASTLINGVAFEASNGGMLSGEVSKDVADLFADVPGFKVIATRVRAVQEPPAQAEGAATGAETDKPTEPVAGQKGSE